MAEILSDLTLESLREILVYLYKSEPIILSLILGDAAKNRRKKVADQNVQWLLRWAMEPPGSVPKKVIEAAFTALVKDLPRQDIVDAIEFVSAFLMESQPYSEVEQ
jgi:hypothetical protein